MKAKEIRAITKHRPFDVPQKPWRYYQEWNKAIFLHWKVDPKALQKLLPKEFELDVCDGFGWISLVAFNMNNIGIRSVPKVPHISDFHELNLRTYIRFKGKPAVYFLSMEGSKKASCKFLKAFSKLPYRYSEMKRTDVSYNVQNIKQQDHFSMTYRLGDVLPHKSDVDLWLTERYALFHELENEIFEYNIHHIEWPMREITVKNLDLKYTKFDTLIHNNPDKVHYSPGVQVLTWGKSKHKK